VTVTLKDLTTNAKEFVKRAVMRRPAPDTSAAEWIAEAPSNCNNSSCTPLTLTNFGSIAFTNATATSVGLDGRHSGAIDDPAWIYGAINLQASNGGFRFGHELRSSATVGALAATGDGFSVTYTGGTQPPGWSPTGPTGTTGTSGASGTSGATGATGA
jgi:hypothetical protein